MTAFTVSGRSSSRVHFATSIFLRCASLNPATRSAIAGSLPWKLIWTWQSPASASQILARGRFAAGEMDLQHADFGELGENLLPFLGGEFAAGAVELQRVGAIGA